jgi:hypothetical protein
MVEAPTFFLIRLQAFYVIITKAGTIIFSKSYQINWAVNCLAITDSISLRCGSTNLPVGALAGFYLVPADADFLLQILTVLQYSTLGLNIVQLWLSSKNNSSEICWSLIH